MPISPMVLHFYNNENEAEKTYTRTFVPWKILKEAVKLQGIKEDAITAEQVDEINSLIVSIFGGQFTKEDLEEKADLGECLAVIQTVLTAALSGLPKNAGLPEK